MKIEDIKVGVIYWDGWMNQPVRVLDGEQDYRGGMYVKRYYKNGRWSHCNAHPEDLRPITAKRLAAFGLRQEGQE